MSRAVGDLEKPPLVIGAVVCLLIGLASALGKRKELRAARVEREMREVEVLEGQVQHKREWRNKSHSKYYLVVSGEESEVEVEAFTRYDVGDKVNITRGKYSKRLLLIDGEPGRRQVVERVVVREIVKVPCPYCASLVENTESQCPQCGGQIR